MGRSFAYAPGHSGLAAGNDNDAQDGLGVCSYFALHFSRA